MSYSLNISIEPHQDVQEAVEERADEYRADTKPEEHVSEALANACGAVVALVNSGAYGDPDLHTFSVVLSGHANENHKPAEGWVNDFISIAIHQL